MVSSKLSVLDDLEEGEQVLISGVSTFSLFSMFSKCSIKGPYSTTFFSVRLRNTRVQSTRGKRTGTCARVRENRQKSYIVRAIRVLCISFILFQ